MVCQRRPTPGVGAGVRPQPQWLPVALRKFAASESWWQALVGIAQCECGNATDACHLCRNPRWDNHLDLFVRASLKLRLNSPRLQAGRVYCSVVAVQRVVCTCNNNACEPHKIGVHHQACAFDRPYFDATNSSGFTLAA